MSYKIENNVPLPEPRNSKAEAVETLTKMKVGDSVFLPTIQISRSWRVYAGCLGVKVAIRQEGEGYRCWKLVG